MTNSKNDDAISAAVWKLTHYKHDTDVTDAALKGDAAAFTNWNQLLTPQLPFQPLLGNRVPSHC